MREYLSKNYNLHKIVLLVSFSLNVLFISYVSRRIYFKYIELPKIKKYVDNKHKEQDGKAPVSYFMNRDKTFSVFPIDSNEIIFIGDSHIHNFELFELLKNSKVRNRGINGESTKGVLDRLADITKRKPEKIFIGVGINDILRGVPADTIKQNLHDIALRIKKESPSTHIFFFSLLPNNWYVYGTKTRATPLVLDINKFMKNDGFGYIDLYQKFQQGNTLNNRFDCGDHLHLNGNGYLLFRDIIEPYL